MSRALTQWRQVATLVLAATVGVSGCAAKPAPAEVAETRASLERALQASHPPSGAGDGKRGQQAWKEVRSLYKANDEQLISSEPIYLVYFTAWEQDGALRTVPDVYGIDRRHDKAAAGP